MFNTEDKETHDQCLPLPTAGGDTFPKTWYLSWHFSIIHCYYYFFFLNTCQSITFQITGLYCLLPAIFHLPCKSGQSYGTKGWKVRDCLPMNPTALRVPQLQDSSKNTQWELLPKQKELRSKRGEGKPSNGAAASQGLSRRGGGAILALNWPIPTFFHHPKSRFYEEFTTLHMATASAEHVV